MYSDALLDAERHHLQSVALWGGASLLIGAILLAILLLAIRSKGNRSPLLMHFALQTSFWGAAVAASSAVRWAGLGFRDLAGATHLDQVVWFTSGTEIGVAATGIAIAITSWLMARRLAGVGAGLAIATQGLALLVLNLQFLTQIKR